MSSEYVKRLKETPHGKAAFAALDERLKQMGRKNAVGMHIADFAEVVFASIDDADRAAKKATQD